MGTRRQWVPADRRDGAAAVAWRKGDSTMRMKQDKQPRRPSKPLAVDQIHPPSDMGKRAKGGDKFASGGLPRRKEGSEQTSVARKAR
jgi:hypothetical protein